MKPLLESGIGNPKMTKIGRFSKDIFRTHNGLSKTYGDLQWLRLATNIQTTLLHKIKNEIRDNQTEMLALIKNFAESSYDIKKGTQDDEDNILSANVATQLYF